MTIPLASAWLHGDKTSVVRTRYDAELRKHLELPTQFNPHSSYAVLSSIAERIVFTDDIPSLLYQMSDNDQLTFTGILRTAKLPYDCFWFEYKVIHDNSKVMYFGALVRKIVGDRVRMIVVNGAPFDNVIRCGITHVVEFPKWPPVFAQEQYGGRLGFGFDLLYAFNKEELKRADADQELALYETIAWMLTELIFGIFLITQPKTYSGEHMVPSDKLQRARKRRGKQPMLEYRRINMRIGKTHKHYAHGHFARQGVRVGQALNVERDTESDDAVRHRRYHKVMGHFRHYLKGDNPHTVWIEPHYRGDPALGVTFTERDVSR